MDRAPSNTVEASQTPWSIAPISGVLPSLQCPLNQVVYMMSSVHQRPFAADAPTVDEEFQEVVAVHRAREQVALRRIAAQVLHPGLLCLRLDALRRDADPERPRHFDHGLHDRQRTRIAHALDGEAAVDLQAVDG